MHGFLFGGQAIQSTNRCEKGMRSFWGQEPKRQSLRCDLLDLLPREAGLTGFAHRPYNVRFLTEREARCTRSFAVEASNTGSLPAKRFGWSGWKARPEGRSPSMTCWACARMNPNLWAAKRPEKPRYREKSCATCAGQRSA